MDNKPKEIVPTKTYGIMNELDPDHRADKEKNDRPLKLGQWPSYCYDRLPSDYYFG